MTPIEFEVVGMPAPQGSKTPKGRIGQRVRMVESSEKVAPWREAVSNAARDVAKHDDVPAPLDGPLRVEILFRFPPTSSWRAADRARGWRWKSTMPDIDKLARSTHDALTMGGLIANDARIVSSECLKIETPGWSGAVISIARIDHEDTP